MVDLFYALTLAQLTTAGSFILANDQAIIVGAILGIILHITSIVLLLRRETINYMLKLA
jgi:nitrate reductase gamma subunit